MKKLLNKATEENSRFNKLLPVVREHYDFVTEDCNKNGTTLVTTLLQGSQNYNMDDEESDVDTKSLVVPNFRQLVLGAKRESKTLVMPNDEHADVKDVQEMMLCWRKQNVNFVEVLYTPYYHDNEDYAWFMNALRAMRDDVSHYSRWYTLMATCGHMTEKYEKLHRGGVARADVVAKFGYDPKQLCHQLRLKDFMEKYFADYDYKECLKPTDSEYLRAVKRGKYDVYTAEALAVETNQWMLKFRENWMNKLGRPDRNEKVDKQLDELTVALYREVMMNEV